MAVAQLSQHISQHLKELTARHLIVHAYLIFIIDRLPVQPIGLFLVVEKAIALIDNLPERLEVTLRRVVELLDINTRAERNQNGQSYQHGTRNLSDSYHSIHGR